MVTPVWFNINSKALLPTQILLNLFPLSFTFPPFSYHNLIPDISLFHLYWDEDKPMKEAATKRCLNLTLDKPMDE